MDAQLLSRLGLTDGEIKVYLTLLELGTAPITTIAEKTQLNRTSLYDIVAGLVEKGFVSEVIDEKKKAYIAAKPTRIMEYLSEKKAALEKDEGDLRRLVDELSIIKPQIPGGLSVEVHRGRKGLLTILEDVFLECKRGDTICAFGLGGSSLPTLLGSYYHKYLFKQISDDFGFTVRMIFPKSEENSVYAQQITGMRLPNLHIQFAAFDLPTHIRIYGNKVAIMLLETEPTVIVISDQKIADGYRAFFEVLSKMQ